MKLRWVSSGQRKLSGEPTFGLIEYMCTERGQWGSTLIPLEVRPELDAMVREEYSDPPGWRKLREDGIVSSSSNEDCIDSRMVLTVSVEEMIASPLRKRYRAI